MGANSYCWLAFSVVVSVSIGVADSNSSSDDEFEAFNARVRMEDGKIFVLHH